MVQNGPKRCRSCRTEWVHSYAADSRGPVAAAAVVVAAHGWSMTPRFPVLCSAPPQSCSVPPASRIQILAPLIRVLSPSRFLQQAGTIYHRTHAARTVRVKTGSERRVRAHTHLQGGTRPTRMHPLA